MEFIGLRGFPMSMLVYSITYLLLTVFFLNKYGKQVKPWLIVVAVLLGTSCVDIVLRFIMHGGFIRTLISLPDFVIRIISIFIGLAYYGIQCTWGKITLASVFMLFSLWCSYFGFGLWVHKYSFDTYTGRIDPRPIPLLDILSSDSTAVDLSAFKNRYLVLDFWNSHCGGCFAEFPDLQNFFDSCRYDKKIALYSIHCRIEKEGETYCTGNKILQKREYTFPCLSVDIDDPALKEMGVNKFPAVIIVDLDGKMIFRGDIDRARKFLDKLVGK